MTTKESTAGQSLPRKFSIREDFPPVDYRQWRAVAEESLGGVPFERKLVKTTYDGIQLQPLYTRQDQLGEGDVFGFPGLSPYVRGAEARGAVEYGWDLRQEHRHPDISACNQAILEDLQGGVTSILIRLDAAARRGLDPDADQTSTPAGSILAGTDGVMVYDVEELDALLAGVHLEMIALSLDAGGACMPAAALLLASWQRRGIDADRARGALNADPLGVLASTGQLPVSLETALREMTDLAQFVATRYPQVRAVAVDTSPYHDAGATSSQDIAFGLATGVEYLRAMVASLDVSTAAQQILFRNELGTHHFLAIAKLRAARRLWAHVVESCGGDGAAAAMRIHARTSRRVLTQRDPYVNLLRNTAAVFAAGIGGAQAITSVPFDVTTGLPSEFSRRVARNTALILQEEAQLHRVIDPAGGSWMLDRLTEQLAQKAWQLFQEIESQGGMATALTNGWVAEQIDQAYAARARDISIRKEGITGVSEFPNLGEERIEHPEVDLAALCGAAVRRMQARKAGAFQAELSLPPSGQARLESLVQAASKGASIGQLARAMGYWQGPAAEVVPLEPRHLAGPFEQLRDASDHWLKTTGRRPSVFLANLGPVAHHTARATYSKNFFEAGGFEVIGSDGWADAAAAASAFASSGAAIAVICSSDKLYPELVPSTAAALKQAGARTVILAGNPGENEPAWRSAGVDRFIFIKCDVLQTLRELLRDEGVLSEKEA